MEGGEGEAIDVESDNRRLQFNQLLNDPDFQEFELLDEDEVEAVRIAAEPDDETYNRIIEANLIIQNIGPVLTSDLNRTEKLFKMEKHLEEIVNFPSEKDRMLDILRGERNYQIYLVKLRRLIDHQKRDYCEVCRQ